MSSKLVVSLCEQFLSGLGERDATVEAFEKRLADDNFELANLPADGSLRDEQFLGRAAEAQ